MKIEKQVEVTVDVEVDVSLEDITASIWTDTDSASGVLRGISNCHRFLKAIPQDLIAAMNDKQRQTILTALTEQAQRFAPTSTPEAK